MARTLAYRDKEGRKEEGEAVRKTIKCLCLRGRGREEEEREKAIVDVMIPLGTRRGRSENMHSAAGDLQSERLADGVGLIKWPSAS